MNTKATQRPQTIKHTAANAPEEYNIPNGVLYTWEEGNWVYTQKIYNSGVTKTTKMLKTKPVKPQKIEWREF